MLNIKISVLNIIYMYILILNFWNKNFLIFVFFWGILCDIFLNFYLGRTILIYFLSTYIMFYLQKKITNLFIWRMFFFVIFFSFLVRIISFLIDVIILNINFNDFILINSLFDGFLWLIITNFLFKKQIFINNNKN